MGQYSELIGSFKRMGTFPLEADYIFNNESELKAFYSQPENYALLHRGLFRIVADPNSNSQELYWVNRKQTNDDLEFVKLISFSDIVDLEEELENLSNKLDKEVENLSNRLDKEIEDRKEADTTIWGTENRTQIPDDLNSILNLAKAILDLRENLKEEIERAKASEEALKSDIKTIVGTEEENIQQYIQANLTYKSLTEISEVLNKFLNTIDQENSEINTFKELMSFLSGYTDKDNLMKILQDLVTSILGTPTPSDDFITLRNIEDFVRVFKTESEHTDYNLQTELDQTQVGVGLSGDGAYNPDKETYYLGDATSVMNALKILDNLINEAINNCNLQGSTTSTAETTISKYKTETIIETNVLVSANEGNSLLVKSDGLYHSITSSYKDGILTLYVNGNVVSQHILGLSYIGIDSAYYDPTVEALVFKFRKEDGTVDEVRVPVQALIREWVTDNSGASDVVVLTKVENYGGNPDTLSADVRLFSDRYNILKKEGNTLYVKGTADNIVWNDIKVSVLLDTINADIESLKKTVVDLSSSVITFKEDLQNKIDLEIVRAKNEEDLIKQKVTIITGDLTTVSEIANQNKSDIAKNATAITLVKTDLSNEITRSTTTEQILDHKISDLNEKVEAISVLSYHLTDYNNPHKVTKEQIGLGLVENIAPDDMPVSKAVKEAIIEATSWYDV